MGRKRSSGGSLPPHMYKQRHTYFFRSPVPPRKWVSLGKELGVALKRYAQVSEIGSVAVLGSNAGSVHVSNLHSLADHNATLEAFTTWYFTEVVPKKAPRTQRDNAREIVRPLAVFGAMGLKAISSRDLRIYHHERGKVAEVRANRELALLSAMFTKAIEFEFHLGPNPCFGIKRFAERARSRYVSDSEFRAVRDAADVALQDVLELALVLGQRPSDTLKIRLGDVDSNRLEIVQGKTGAKLSIQVQGSFKQVLVRVLCRFRKPGVTQLAVDGAGDALTQSVLRRLFDEARVRAGVSFQLRDLRAKNATDADDIFLAQQRLGHSTITTTQKYIRTRKGSTVKPLESAAIDDLSGA